MSLQHKQSSLRARAGAALVWLTLGVAALATSSQAAVVLQYHHVAKDTPAATSITPELFRQHMAHLEEAGYTVVALPELVERLKGGKALPEKAVAITFDDGYESVYEEAFPVLKEYGWPFTVFVNTRPLQHRLKQFVTWNQLREMAEAGGTIANHSYSHPHLLRRQGGESDREWRQRIRDEIVRAEKQIAAETGQRHKLFAYPYGEYDRATKALLAELGYAAFGQQSGPVSPEDDLQALPRFPFGGAYGEMEDFRVKAASVPMPMKELQVHSSGERLHDTVLPAAVERPRLVMVFPTEALAGRVQCFASGQGLIPVQVEGAQISARAGEPLPVGRSRYNCTAASQTPGRFHWYSRLFIRKQPDGQWYPEP